MRTMLVLVVMACCSRLIAAEPSHEAVVARGLEAMVRVQRPDGSFGESNAVTALAGMALLAGGHTPTRGVLHVHTLRALRAVIARQDAMTGYLGADFGTMYAHGFSTLFLAECQGLAQQEPVRRVLEGAVGLIHRSQNPEGGWKYTPVPGFADLSVTVCQVMALRGAYNVGIGGQASQDAIARALGYVRRCAQQDGSFAYLPGLGPTMGDVGLVPLTAAGAMCLIGAGPAAQAEDLIAPALGFLRRHAGTHLVSGGGDHYWYGQYYAAQALFHSPDLEDWTRHWDHAWRVIAARQGVDGLWPSTGVGGPAYATAMALIILQIPNGYLPIFQR